MQVPRVDHTRLEYKGDVQRVNAVHELRSYPYKIGVRVSTASQTKTWWSVEDFD